MALNTTDILSGHDDTAVRTALTKILFSNGRRSNLVSLVAVFVVLYITWGQFSTEFAVIWGFLTSFVIVYRLGLVKQYFNSQPDDKKSRAYYLTYLSSVFLISLCWAVIGAAGMLLPEFHYRVFFILLLVSLIGASVSALAASITAIFLYILPPFAAALPILIWRGGYDSAIGTALILYVYMIIRSGQNVNEALRSAIDMQLYSQRINHELEEIVDERTEQLKISRDEAEEASREKSIFLAKMSHEIRTPMNAIVNFNNLAMQEDLPEKAKEYLTQVKNSGDSLVAIINDVLDFSKIESGKIEIERTPYSFAELVNELYASFLIEAKKKGLDLTCTMATTIQEKYIGDPLRTRQILANLIDNAIKFTDSGKITVHAEQQEATNQPVLHIKVKDTGIGISQNSIKRLFEPFQQADNSTSRRFGGTGLGLVISKQFVELMGGGIDVFSEEGKGSTFSVTLPVKEFTQTADDSNNDHANSSEAEVQQRMAPYAGKRILVVDDTETNRLIVEHILDNVNIRTLAAEDGEQAVEMLKEHDIDMVFMDIQMPGMDGYQATREIREILGRKSLPVIAMTANILPQDIEACYAAGMNHCIIKPVDVETIFQAIEEYIPLGP